MTSPPYEGRDREGVNETIKFNDMRKKENIHYNLIFRPEPEGGFTVIVPALPGCVTYGRTLAEARGNAADAIGGYIASLQKHGEEIPSDEQSFITSLDFEIVKPYAAAT